MWNLKKLGILVATSLSVLSAQASPDTIQVINHGVAAFEKRFEMIDRAEKSIDVEYFIYNTDEAGRIFSQALAKKKKENPSIKIRVLVDASELTLKLKKKYVDAFAAHGIEVRQYNTVSLARNFKKAQYRDHRKLIVIDGKEAITGSRNIADEYFDLSEEFNFRDRDIWVEGPVAQEMQSHFEEYWKHPLSKKFPQVGTVDETDFFQENSKDRQYRAAIRNLGRPILAERESTGQCDSLTYVSDPAGHPIETKRPVLAEIFSRLHKMNEGDTLYVESPYFIILDKNARDEMALLKERRIHAVLLTNSLASTDAFYVAANFQPKVSFYSSISDSEMFIYSGDTPKDTPFIRRMNKKAVTEKSIWGIHSKTLVFSDDTFSIGTFNLDPRSANLNNEMMITCQGNKDLASFVTDDIKARISQSDLLGKDGKLANGKSMLDGIDRWKRIKFKIAKKPAQWFAWMF